MTHTRCWLFAGILLFCCLVNIPKAAADPLRWGKITNNPQKDHKRMFPMANQLSQALATHGVTGVELVFRDSIPAMQAAIDNGEVDFVVDTLYAAITLERAGVVSATHVEWRDNTGSYRSIFFVRKDSGLQSVADLKGKVVVFEDAGSTSAFFLPHQALLEQGFRLHELAWLDSLPDLPKDVDAGFVFAQTEENIPRWVHEGRAHAGAFSKENFFDDDIVPPAMREELTILHETKDYPRALLLMRNTMSPRLRTALSHILETGHTDPAFFETMQNYKKVKQYTPISDDVRKTLNTLGASLPRHSAEDQ